MRALLASLAICLLVPVPAHSQTVGMLGDWQKIEFEGLQEVDEDEIRHALAGDLEYQAAARPSASLEKFLEITERRIKEGFRHSGYVKASVDVGYDAVRDRAVALVDEGAKYTLGEIRVVGNSHIDAEQIKAVLMARPRERAWSYRMGNDCLGQLMPAEQRNSEPTWVPGTTARFDLQSYQRLWEQTRFAVSDAGFVTSNFDLIPKIDSDQEKVGLLIKFRDNSPPAAIDKIVIQGLQRHTQDEILDFVEIREHGQFSADLLDRVHEKLRNSCRFWRHPMYVGVLVPDASNGQRNDFVQLTIEAIEYTHVPKLGKPLPAVDDALRRAAYWLEDYGRDVVEEQGDFVLDYRDSNGPLRGRLRVALSPRSGWVATINGDWAQEYAIDHSMIVNAEEWTVISWLQQRKLNMPGKLPTMNMFLRPGVVENGDYKQSLRVGSSLGSAGTNGDSQPLTVSVEPVVLVNLAHRDETKTRFGKNETTISNDQLSLTIESKTGRIVEFTLKNPDPDIPQTLHAYFNHGVYQEDLSSLIAQSESLVDDYSDSAPWPSVARFVLAELIAQPVLGEAEDALLQKIWQHVDSDRLDNWIANWKSSGTLNAVKSEPVYSIPQIELTDEDWLAELWAFLPGFADLCFPRGSWQWTAIREYGFSAVNEKSPQRNSKGVIAELNRCIDTQEAGPISAGLATVCLISSHPASARRCAKYGSSQLTDEAFLRDISPFIDGDLWAAKAIEFLVRNCHELDENEIELASDLAPKSLRDPAKKLITRRKSQPDEHPREAVRAVLLECWRQTWRDQMEAEFTRLANLPDDQTVQAPLEPYPSTGIGPNDPFQVTPPTSPPVQYPSTGLPPSLADPTTANELWPELK